MTYFAMMVFLWVAAASQEALSDEEDARVGEMLNFIELSLATMLQHGHFPALYNSSYPRIKECGCYYTPKKITWGNEIGLECVRRKRVDGEELPEFNVMRCGARCNDVHGSNTALICPPLWISDCRAGCLLPKQFRSAKDRADFWDFMLVSFLRLGTDYISIQQEQLEQCGCSGKYRRIWYGTEIGFECVIGDGAVVKNGCRSTSNCKNDRGERLVTFCPYGYKSMCEGCEKDDVSEELITRLEWMVRVTSDLVQHSLPTLGWHPGLERVLGCGCKGSVNQITYGMGIGLFCEIHSPDHVDVPSCGAHIICNDAEGRNILHICPRGFTPSCEFGCANPIITRKHLKSEL